MHHAIRARSYLTDDDWALVFFYRSHPQIGSWCVGDLFPDVDDRRKLREFFIEEHSNGSIRRSHHAASAKTTAARRESPIPSGETITAL